MIEAVLFDNDGVLVETEHLYLQAGREMLAEVGIDLTLELYQEISLRQGRSVMDLAAEHGHPEATVRDLRDRRNRRYADLLERGVEVRPGAREAVEELGRQGRRLAIVTTCPGRHFEVQHRNTGLLDHFEKIVVREAYPNSKPFPDPYLKTLELMGLAPDVCVAIEDTQRGVDAATTAGIRCFACTSPMTAGTTFERAVRVLDSVGELPAAVRQLETSGDE